jgi:serine/threonine protein phosphatase PrpC
MQVTTHWITETGSRDYNDDSCADANLMAGRCIIVADGAGGHKGGAVASKLVVDSVLLHLASAPTWDDGALLAALDAASASVHWRQNEDRGISEMSSTAAVLCIDAVAGRARWTHLGDTRILFFRRGNIEQLTRDHSVVQSFIDAGVYDGEMATGRPDRSVLYAAIGAEGETRPTVGSRTDLEDGDAFLVCTDGVWDTIREETITTLLNLAGSVEEWVSSIASVVRTTAKEKQDNYSAVGVWIGSPEQITVIKV